MDRDAEGIEFAINVPTSWTRSFLLLRTRFARRGEFANSVLDLEDPQGDLQDPQAWGIPFILSDGPFVPLFCTHRHVDWLVLFEASIT